MNKVNGPSGMPESIGGVPAGERETVIRKDCLDGLAHICTTSAVEYNRLMAKCRRFPGVWRAVGYEVCAGQPQVGYFEAPAKLVRYASPAPEPSGERKAEMAARMKAMRDARGKGRAGSPAKEGGAPEGGD